jgi:hypothetical protein
MSRFMPQAHIAINAAEDLKMTPEQRMAIMLDAAQQGLARVCRVIDLKQS